MLVASCTRASVTGCCSDELLRGVATPDTTGSWLASGTRRGGMSPIWIRWTRAATSDPMRELTSRDPRMEKESSSSAAALTLALSSGRSDSFSSRALNVVPDVMLLPSKLGGFVPSSELESTFCDTSSDEGCVWLELEELAFPMGPSAVASAVSFSTRSGVSGAIFSACKSFSMDFSAASRDGGALASLEAVNGAVFSVLCVCGAFAVADGDALGFSRADVLGAAALVMLSKLSCRVLEPSTMAPGFRDADPPVGRSFFVADAATCEGEKKVSDAKKKTKKKGPRGTRHMEENSVTNLGKGHLSCICRHHEDTRWLVGFRVEGYQDNKIRRSRSSLLRVSSSK